ncbi:hypothetical protein C8R47DRAFT_1295792 [Mycena vitilis]|nr:hypothetical protein C8R47DRAFT_1295792 [Mycena vitilis]
MSTPLFTMDDANTTNAVPPTTHRVRMMRSMRKLTAVLGETPIVEMPSPAPQLLAPSKRGFFFQASASLSSLSLALPFQKSESAHDDRPALVLRLPETETETFAPLPHPLSPSFSPTLLSPTTPTTPPREQEDRDRRRRLAKVARTLGEHVPPNLILSTPAAVRRRRRASTLIIPESALEQQVFAAPVEACHSRRLSVGGGHVLKRAVSFIALRTDAPLGGDSPEECGSTSPLHVHPPLAFSPDTLVSPSEWLRPRSQRFSRASQVEFSRMSQVDPLPVVQTEAETELGAPPSYDESHLHGPIPLPTVLPVRSDSLPRARLRAQISDMPRPQSSALPEMQRNEDEWTGEWGGDAGNMDDVIQRLRTLRGRR